MKFIDKIKRNKLLYFLGVLIVGIFIVLIVRFTYAYLAANVNEARGDVTLNSDETDKLDFAVGDPLSIDATPTTLPENGENLVDTTTATATLLANSTNTTAEYSYWVYFTISNNTFIYSDGLTPEVILTVTDPEGNPVTNIEGLTYGTFSGVAGFDVTTQNGTFTVANGYTITSSSSTDATEQTWNFTLTYLNQSYDQSINFGNSMTTEVSMSKEEVVLAYHETCTPGTMACDIARLYTEDGENGLYLHDGNGTYGSQEAGDNSYRYAGANPNNYVCFGSDAASCPSDNLYRIIGVFGNQVKLIKADFANSDLLGTDGNYSSNTYSASYYANYKGSKETINRYDWNYSNGSSSTNDWIASRLNTVNLNTNYINYLNTIDSKWTEVIATTEWKVGGNTLDNIEYTTPANAYQNEIVNPAESTTYSAKIGLMYVSDYYYGAEPTYWTYHGYTNSSKPNEEGQYGEEYDYRAAINDNWMYSGIVEWTISRNSDSTDVAFYVNDSGYVLSFNGVGNRGVRPSFYLESSVEFSKGSGSSADPYRI